ncbi:MAG: ceramide glucosyltransferase [Candidatus Solibacter sp.]|nr:ceramide glucosyltransferase [Candidatus Solibacter sp.]
MIPTILLACVVAGSWVFCVLAVLAARSYRRQPVPRLQGEQPPLSVLKPLHGLDDGLEENLRTFFEQDYPDFELLFAARSESDPGLTLARRLAVEYPHRPCRFFVTGEPAYPNAKVFSLETMTEAAANEILVMADSDIRAPKDLLATLAAEFQHPRLGVATCPYRAVPGRSFWSRLEAIGMNTEFWGGVFTARLVERGVRFAVGPAAAARKQAIADAGGWKGLSQYLAEDFVLGQSAAAAGWEVILSRAVVEHRIGSQAFRANMIHRLRWNRSTRRSRPAGYAGQLFTYPLPVAFALAALEPALWWALIPAAGLRAWAAYEVAVAILDDTLTRRNWWLVPFQDLLSILTWIAAFQGNTIEWRGSLYLVDRQGRLVPR